MPTLPFLNRNMHMPTVNYFHMFLLLIQDVRKGKQCDQIAKTMNLEIIVVFIYSVQHK
jgi:hypothetical protein